MWGGNCIMGSILAHNNKCWVFGWESHSDLRNLNSAVLEETEAPRSSTHECNVAECGFPPRPWASDSRLSPCLCWASGGSGHPHSSCLLSPSQTPRCFPAGITAFTDVVSMQKEQSFGSGDLEGSLLSPFLLQFPFVLDSLSSETQLGAPRGRAGWLGTSAADHLARCLAGVSWPCFSETSRGTPLCFCVWFPPTYPPLLSLKPLVDKILLPAWCVIILCFLGPFMIGFFSVCALLGTMKISLIEKDFRHRWIRTNIWRFIYHLWSS